MQVMRSPQSKLNILHEESAEALLNLWLPAEPETVSMARHAAVCVCLKAGISDDECADMDLALGEALANAVLYNKQTPGNKATTLENLEDRDRQVGLCVWDYHDHLILRIHNRHSSSKLPQPPYNMPSPNSGATKGRGLPLMQALMDAMIICQGAVDEGGTSVFLVKNIPTRS